MKSFRYLSFSSMLILFALQATAQQGHLSISGKVGSLENGKPLYGVSISISRKGIGIATNAKGLFALIIPNANLKDTLKISYVGFKTQLLPVANLTDGQQLNITLDKNSTELKEVSIEYHDALKIIRKAIERIPDNYIDHPHILRGFYRMYTYNDNDPLQLSEAVFDVYNFGYADKHADLFKLIKARNEKNNRNLGMLEFGQKPNSIFEEDLVNHLYTSGFLSEDGLDKHQFEVSGIVDFKGYEAYQIDFTEKVGEYIGTFRGRMYIQTKTYAFICFDYGLSELALREKGYSNFITHTLMKTGNAQIQLKQDHAVVNYQEVGNKWVLANVTGNDVLTINNINAHVNFNYQVTAVDTIAKEPFSSKLGKNENINHYESNAGEKFWNDYNILLSDYNTEDIFKQLQAINKLNKR